MALPRKLAEAISAPVLLIVPPPDPVWFFHAAGVDEPSYFRMLVSADEYILTLVRSVNVIERAL